MLSVIFSGICSECMDSSISENVFAQEYFMQLTLDAGFDAVSVRNYHPSLQAMQ
jgi:hypothetical protein